MSHDVRRMFYTQEEIDSMTFWDNFKFKAQSLWYNVTEDIKVFFEKNER